MCIDSGDVPRLLKDNTFVPKARSLESERLVREKILKSTDGSIREKEDPSSHVLLGGAGEYTYMYSIEPRHILLILFRSQN